MAPPPEPEGRKLTFPRAVAPYYGEAPIFTHHIGHLTKVQPYREGGHTFYCKALGDVCPACHLGRQLDLEVLGSDQDLFCSW